MILITHIDLDGVGCDIVAKYFYTKLEMKKTYYYDYDQVDSIVNKLLKNTQDKIIITDVSIREQTASLINSKYSDRVKIYDHHKTAQSYLKDYDWAIIDTTRSATKLFFDTLCSKFPNKKIPQSLEKLVFHVNDYDLWLRQSPDSNKLNSMLKLLGLHQFSKTISSRIKNGEFLINHLDCLYLKGLEENKKVYFCQRSKQAVVVGNRLVIVASNHISELCQHLRDIKSPPAKWQNVDYIDILNFELRCHSLRTYEKNFDVSQVAETNGGGGHPKAAGYPMKIDETGDWLKSF